METKELPIKIKLFIYSTIVLLSTVIYIFGEILN